MVIEIFENLGYCSQGSVAMPTQLKCDACDGISFSNHFITKIPPNLLIKNLKIVNLWQTNGQKFDLTFFGPPCSSVIKNRRT